MCKLLPKVEIIILVNKFRVALGGAMKFFALLCTCDISIKCSLKWLLRRLINVP